MLRAAFGSLLLSSLFAGTLAFCQTSAPACDLTYVDRPKPHLTFTGASDADVSALLGKGYADSSTGKADFEQALQLAQQKHDACGEALAEYGLSAATERSHTAEIEQHLRKAEEIFMAQHATHALAQTHFVLGRVLQREGKPADGAVLVRQSAEEFSQSGDGVHAIGSKLSALLMVQTDPSEKELNALIDEARALNSQASAGSILHLWGDTDFANGHFDSALQRYQQSRKVLEDCHCDDFELATVLVSMGRLERMQGQPELAIKDYEVALKLQHAIGEDEYSIQTMNAMAVAYDALGKRRESLEMYEHALEQANAVGAKQFVPLLEGNIGGQYLKLSEWDAAARQLQMVIDKGASDYQLCIRYGQLSEALRNLKRADEAYSAADKATAICRKGGDQESLADSLEDRAEAASAQKNYETALADIRETLGIREAIRAHLVPDDARKQGYNERIQDLYDTSIELLTTMGRQREALEVAEQGRARAFLDLMGTQGVADEKKVAIDAPSFASYVSAAPYTAAEMIAAAAHYNSTIIAYWASAKALYIWVVNGKGDVEEVRVPETREHLARLVRETTEGEKDSKSLVASRSGIKTRGGETVAVEQEKNTAWRTLYDWLIAPVEKYLPRERGALLTIIPHHELFRLSFAALTNAHDEYLVQRYALHSVPASALLRYTEANEARANALPPHYLLVANPSGVTLEGGAVLPSLPETLTEVRSIARLLPASEITSLAGAKAQQEAVADALNSATIAHFATHAVMDDVDPRKSFLLLYPASTAKEPVRLTTADVYRLKLHTKLVVLSACRTGLGKITGDGIDGFSRAFFYAGTASFLATLWDVADEPTAMLLPRFYRDLSTGKSRSAALRSAQLELIAAMKAGKVKAKTPLGDVTLPESPKFWASFALSGEP